MRMSSILSKCLQTLKVIEKLTEINRKLWEVWETSHFLKLNSKQLNISFDNNLFEIQSKLCKTSLRSTDYLPNECQTKRRAIRIDQTNDWFERKDNNYWCLWPECHYKSSISCNIQRHILSIHSSVRQFKCDFKECNKRFAIKGRLKRHQKSHYSNKSKFCCGFNGCQQLFKQRSSLMLHKKKIHWKVCKFKCHFEGCGKGFVTNYCLKVHKVTHSSVKPFKCEVCEQEFKNKWYLNVHKKSVHTKQAQFKCNENNCSKAFVHKSKLVIHQLSHSKDRPFKCGVKSCGKAFKLEQHLTRHNISKHSNRTLI